jgi:hypothetical protein
MIEQYVAVKINFFIITTIHTYGYVIRNYI